MTQDKNKNWT